MAANVLINVRGARPEDASELLDIDIKCFDFAWSSEEWQNYGRSKQHAISVATVYGTPVGFAVFMVSKDEGSEDGVELLKLAVKKAHRKSDVSLHLLNAVSDFGTKYKANHIFTIVPESTIYPGPRNIAAWLTAVGFKAIKPFLKNRFDFYGEREPGVKFIMPIEPPRV